MSFQLSVSSGVVTSYSATLIRGLGYDPKRAALMNTPSGAVSIFFTLFVGFGIRLQSHRWAFIIACIIPAYVIDLTPPPPAPSNKRCQEYQN